MISKLLTSTNPSGQKGDLVLWRGSEAPVLLGINPLVGGLLGDWETLGRAGQRGRLQVPAVSFS